MSEELTPPPPVRWGRLIAIIAVVIAIPAVAIEYNKHRRFVAWSQQRAAWLEKCEPYQQSLNPSIARACNEELQRLMAIAKEEGWVDTK